MVWRCSAHGVFLVVGMKVLGTPLGIGSLVAGAVGLAVAVAILLRGCAAARRRA